MPIPYLLLKSPQNPTNSYKISLITGKPYIRKILDNQSTIGKASPIPHGQLGINSQLLPDWLGTCAVCWESMREYLLRIKEKYKEND